MKRIWVAAALALGITIPGIKAVSADQIRPTPTRSYVVAPGDTLWGIAGQAGFEGDRRGAVDRIVKLNHLGPEPITPGQTLQLPLR